MKRLCLVLATLIISTASEEREKRGELAVPVATVSSYPSGISVLSRTYGSSVGPIDTWPLSNVYLRGVSSIDSTVPVLKPSTGGLSYASNILLTQSSGFQYPTTDILSTSASGSGVLPANGISPSNNNLVSPVIGATYSGNVGSFSGIAPTGVAAGGIAPSGVAAGGIAPAGVAAGGITPAGISSSGIAPTGLSAYGVAPSGIAPAGTYPSGIVSSRYPSSGAATRAQLGASGVSLTSSDSIYANSNVASRVATSRAGGVPAGATNSPTSRGPVLFPLTSPQVTNRSRFSQSFGDRLTGLRSSRGSVAAAAPLSETIIGALRGISEVSASLDGRRYVK